jgi:DNA-directed RNA polymerase specialized sigma24 family protein
MVLDQERDAELWRAFETLPERSKVLLRAMLADPELSYAELSEALDMPIGSIGPTRARCLAKLRVLVSTQGASENQNERDTARPRRKVS